MNSVKTQARKPADARRKDLEMAISRIERGRAHTKAAKVSIASVARESGVSAALIHNYYPDVAEAIREIQGRSSRAVRDLKHQELRAERVKNKSLLHEIDQLRAQVAKLASINEVLLTENRVMKAKQTDPKVVDLAGSITAK